MRDMSSYEVVSVDQDPDAYRTLTERYWKWVFERDCDANSNKGDVTFMRDSVIGEPEDPGENIQDIGHRAVGMNIFFPVYHCHYCQVDPYYKGGKCDSPDKLMDHAKYDLNKVKEIWATISINGGPAVPITENLNDHSVTLYPFDLTVGPNNANREPEYHLEPGTYPGGVVSGTYMLLRNINEGAFVLDFGGNATDFHTHSKYTMTVP